MKSPKNPSAKGPRSRNAHVGNAPRIRPSAPGGRLPADVDDSAMKAAARIQSRNDGDGAGAPVTEEDIERRLRMVVTGPRPSAPDSLHRFLHELPEALPAPKTSAWARFRCGIAEIFHAVPGFVTVAPYARRAQLAFGLVLACAVGVAGGSILLSLRHPMLAPAQSGSPATWEPTPRTTLAERQSPLMPGFTDYPDIQWQGVPTLSNENMALPVSAVLVGSHYLGVTMPPFGQYGIVESSDGLFWNWKPATTIDPKAAKITSIASYADEIVVVTGAVQTVDGAYDGRIWISIDGGSTWRQTDNESLFSGVVVRTVICSPGSGVFLALGWNDTSPTDAMRPVAEWISSDGISWSSVPTPVQGTTAMIAATPVGFVLSGNPLSAGTIDEPPMWFSTDGVQWKRSKATDNTAQRMGRLASMTVTRYGAVFALALKSDGETHELVFSQDGGMTWMSIRPVENSAIPYPEGVDSLVSLSGPYSTYLFAASSMGNAIWVSKDSGTNWEKMKDMSVGGPMAQFLIQIGPSYSPGATKVLAYGKADSHLGIWLASGMTNW
jgi:hypothetical protein